MNQRTHINVDLLLQAVDRIAKHPEFYDQGRWGRRHAMYINEPCMCDSACCIAGTLAEILKLKNWTSDDLIESISDSRREDFNRLFMGNWPKYLAITSDSCGDAWAMSATADEAVAAIHDFIRTNGWQNENHEPKDTQ